MRGERIGWVILTMGDRETELRAAIESIRRHAPTDPVAIVLNGDDVTSADLPDVDHIVRPGCNLGVPGGRDLGLRTLADRVGIVAFLDDDAQLISGDRTRLLSLFSGRPDVSVVAFKIVDEFGESARRHNPRLGQRGANDPGEVATFLGGACAVRVASYLDVGGYWPELFYGHEELDLAWRLAAAGRTVWFDPETVVEHPRTTISRHPTGWSRTGLNRVRVARRNLPRGLCALHCATWLVIGMVRSPERRAYLRGWLRGWTADVNRAPMGWKTALQLARRGRPPLF